MRRGHRPLGALVALVAAASVAGPASAATPSDTNALQNAVSVGGDNSGIRQHLRALQVIADKPGNDGTRATATPGHEDSVAYVKQQLAAAGGYSNVYEQPFEAAVFEELAPPTLSSVPGRVAGLGRQHRFRDDGRVGQRQHERHAAGLGRLRPADVGGQHVELRL